MVKNSGVYNVVVRYLFFSRQKVPIAVSFLWNVAESKSRVHLISWHRPLSNDTIGTSWLWLGRSKRRFSLKVHLKVDIFDRCQLDLQRGVHAAAHKNLSITSKVTSKMVRHVPNLYGTPLSTLHVSPLFLPSMKMCFGSTGKSLET